MTDRVAVPGSSVVRRLASGLLITASALAALTPASSAQSRNVTLLGRFNPSESVSDVWGYVDPATGKEYAILLSYRGTYVLDCSNPARPTQRGFFPRVTTGSGNLWRDARTYGHYLYVVSEANAGMQIIDLSNPDNPQFVRNHDPSGVFWRNSHNISIDTQAGKAYVCGAAGGMLILDLAANPIDPPYLGAYQREYVHDMQAQDGFAYLSEINRGNFRVTHVQSLPAVTVVGTASQRLAHQSWPTRDGDYAVCCSEDFGVGFHVYDVRNKGTPTSIATWRTGGSRAIVHNAFLYDRTVHLAYYSEGYRAVDLTDPANPIEVGYYDTHPATQNYTGAWGCYPFQPSGNVYISDMDRGLFVLKPAATSTEYGDPTPGTGGVIPEMHLFGSAWIGNSRFGLEVDDAPPGASTSVLIGISPLNLGYLGLTLLVDTAGGAVFSTTASSNGTAFVPVAVPNSASLIGAPLYVQGFVQDAGGSLGFAATAGRSFSIYRR